MICSFFVLLFNLRLIMSLGVEKLSVTVSLDFLFTGLDNANSLSLVDKPSSSSANPLSRTFVVFFMSTEISSGAFVVL